MRFLFLLAILLTTFVMSIAQNNFSPAKESLKLFKKYVPVIEKKNDALVDVPTVITGDINGDQKDDCIIFFVLTPRDGGNLIIGRQAAIYLNTGSGMKVVGAFPSYDFCYVIKRIKDQVIYADEYECVPPYFKVIGKRKFVYSEGKISQLP